MQMRVILKSGVQFEVPVEGFTVERNTFTGTLTGLSWTPADDAASKLNFLRLDDVSAIIRMN